MEHTDRSIDTGVMSEVMDTEATSTGGTDTIMNDTGITDTQVVDTEVEETEIMDTEVLDREQMAKDILDPEVLRTNDLIAVDGIVKSAIKEGQAESGNWIFENPTIQKDWSKQYKKPKYSIDMLPRDSGNTEHGDCKDTVDRNTDISELKRILSRLDDSDWTPITDSPYAFRTDFKRERKD